MRSEKFQCLLVNIEDYRKLPGEQLLIFPEKCPKTNTAELLNEDTENSIYSIDTVTNSPERPAEVITFKKSELDCVANIEIVENSPIMEIPKKPCP